MVRLAFVVIKITVEVIGEKEYPEYGKHYEEFYNYNDPQCFAKGHTLEPIAENNVKLVKGIENLHIFIRQNSRVSNSAYKNINIFDIFMSMS